MPTYTIPINDKSAFAIGDLLMVSPYSDLTFFGNLFYGMYTRGTAEKNFTVGIGLWTMTEGDMSAKTISPAVNISAMLKTGYNSYFITENYAFQYNLNEYAEYNDPYIFTSEEFMNEKYIIWGISGFRVIGKNYPRNSWQFSLAYFFIKSGGIPDKYKQDYWYVGAADDKTNFFAFPILTYTRKF